MAEILDTWMQGEKAVAEIPVTDLNDNPINFVDLTIVTVDIYDTLNKTFQKTKAGSTVVVGTNANDIKFELLETESDQLRAGKVRASVYVEYADGTFADGTAKKKFRVDPLLVLTPKKL